MKPSERIKELELEELKENFPNTNSSPYAVTEAIIHYLDEEYEKTQSETEIAKRNLI